MTVPPDDPSPIREEVIDLFTDVDPDATQETGQLVHRRRLGLEPDLDPQRHRPALQDPEQLAASQRREAVAARAGARPPVVDVDIGPAREARGVWV